MTASESTDRAQLPDHYGVSAPNIRPVTIRQLLDAKREHSQALFKIDDIEVDCFSLVAHLVSVRNQGAAISFELEDGTRSGRINAKVWISDMNREGLPEPPSGSGTYVQIVGKLDKKQRSSTDRNVIQVEKIRKVADPPNELFFHILEAAFVTLSLERGPPPVAAAGKVDSGIATAPPSPSVHRNAPATPSRVVGSSSRPERTAAARSPEPAMSPSPAGQDIPPAPPRQRTPETPIRSPAPARQPTRAASPSPSPTPSPPPKSPSPGASSPAPPQTPPPERPTRSKRRQPGIKRDPYADLTVLQRAILLRLMKAPQPEDGVDVVVITRAVGHHEVTSDQISAALDELVELGHIETTIDETHYAVKTSHYPRSP